MKSDQIFNHFNFIILLVLSTLVLTSCRAGNGVGLDKQGRPVEESQSSMQPNEPPSDDEKGDGEIKASLASIQAQIFTPICSSCHGGANPAAGQDLSSLEKSIESLINVQSSNGLFKRVLPSAAEQSYLYLKVTGNSQAGARMPLGQPSLTQKQIDAIRNWINDGALVPESAQVSAKIHRVIMPISNNQHVFSAEFTPDFNFNINFLFNKAMDFSHLTQSQILIRVSDQKHFLAENSWPLADDLFSVFVVNEHQLKVKILLKNNEQKLFSSVRIEFNQQNISTITTALGQELDGNSDGIDGGVYRYDFSL
jgi:mono/diheme cytochrome c family protein